LRENNVKDSAIYGQGKRRKVVDLYTKTDTINSLRKWLLNVQSWT